MQFQFYAILEMSWMHMTFEDRYQINWEKKVHFYFCRKIIINSIDFKIEIKIKIKLD